jgi:hypothetical protein
MRHGIIMASRIIMRIELTSGAKSKFEAIPESSGMTQLAVTNKLILWFLDQDEELQTSVLGLYPGEVTLDVTTMAMKKVISTSKKPHR